MKKIILPMLCALVLSACQTAPVQSAKTSLEIQAIQSKTFDADKATTFKSVMSVLQDLGYVVNSASLETGFITAESPTVKDKSGGAVFDALFGGIRTEVKTAVTASVEDLVPTSTKVRLNFVYKKARSGAYGQRASDDTPIQDPKAYETAFEKIGEAIFIRTAQK